MVPYDPRKMAEQIANGHAYEKHVQNQDVFSDVKNGKYGADLNIKTSSESESRVRFADHIAATMLAPDTLALKGIDRKTGLQTRDIYFNEKTNTVVIVNHLDSDGGTCYRKTYRPSIINQFVDAENDTRNKLGMQPVDSPRAGGFPALHPQLTSNHDDMPTFSKVTARTAQEMAGPTADDTVKAEIALKAAGRAAPLAESLSHHVEPATHRDAQGIDLTERTIDDLRAETPWTSTSVAGTIHAAGTDAALADGGARLNAGSRVPLVAKAGRVLGPLGLAIDAQTLNEAFQRDGNRIGNQTGRATSGIVGSWSGAIAGAESGAIIGIEAGSVIPGVGTAVGAAVGGTAGAVAGGITGDWIGRRLYDRVKKLFSSASQNEPLHNEVPATHARPDAASAPRSPSGTPIAGGDTPFMNPDRIASMYPDTGVATRLPSPVEVAKAQEAAVRALWTASVAGSNRVDAKPTENVGLEHESAALWQTRPTPKLEQIVAASPPTATVTRNRSLRL